MADAFMERWPISRFLGDQHSAALQATGQLQNFWGLAHSTVGGNWRSMEFRGTNTHRGPKRKCFCPAAANHSGVWSSFDCVYILKIDKIRDQRLAEMRSECGWRGVYVAAAIILLFHLRGGATILGCQFQAGTQPP